MLKYVNDLQIQGVKSVNQNLSVECLKVGRRVSANDSTNAVLLIVSSGSLT